MNEVIEPTTAVILPDEASAAEVIIHSITQTVLKRAERAREGVDIHNFPSLIKKPDCFVQHREDDRPVSSSRQLMELVRDSPEIVYESGYHAPDHESVYLLRVMLSDSYVCRVSNIMLRDVPLRYYNQAYGKSGKDGVTVRSFKNRHRGGPQVLKLLCIDLAPVWSDQEIDEIPQSAYAKYHCVSMKIHRESMDFMGWFPGLDTRSQPCASL